MMPVPIRASRKPAYRGRDLTKAQRVADQNRIIDRIERRANEILANCPDDWQTLSFGQIANDLCVDVKLVWFALSDGNQNGIGVRVAPSDRELLEPFKRCPHGLATSSGRAGRTSA
ncbi:hypothetical protein EOA33_10750 [Mesorhizobium sp. M4A.F.Ca.ET.050.02.1.1]|uniref:hypothetical protein n=1 Tax=Mesorhizobium sp. M4A.F.Ca.ET.050.02.1.1 TaxID=2496754 RepID=UPI000FCCDE13|nr:hypothetical protein [Mesorhizobium sp. M4A.F.Ca.ET.050.02.1.1]RUX50042.1 hypothetical protein EOA33_10750 [Mesorhizobium sp. M4A.F.Ca.ET.050.02.1.1]TIT73195.1 MAG: hypothetical protein E5W60_02805 [Mesorhizobium sp.]